MLEALNERLYALFIKCAYTLPSTEQEIDKLQNESEVLEKLLSKKKLDENHNLLTKNSFPPKIFRLLKYILMKN